ncbi:hypothetical protein T492DRAFT_845503 [Pavlovales sp. CCMP2436]|nr:hypothetical protein T492DRAFT_845503 [Pavlovales sp. CCMP2436]|mmetsp:Transcript_50260/g.115305  ORF Transcript_50260/g.115305 Transcript_50260/m.115305 type:complete len:403 (+) Transcript_50260:139-1347(+)
MAIPVHELREVREAREVVARETPEVRVTDLGTDILMHVLGSTLLTSADMSSVFKSCRTLSILDPYSGQYKIRWGKDGVPGPRASVGKMAYALRNCIEQLVVPLRELRTTPRFKTDAVRFEGIWLTIDMPAYMTFCNQIATKKKSISIVYTYPPLVARGAALENADTALASCATSATSARALMAALKQGLYFLSLNENVGEVEEGCAPHKFEYRVCRFVLVGPRGDLVVFNSTDVASLLDYATDSRQWKLHATVVKVDEPRCARAIMKWFGNAPEGWIDYGPKAPSPPPGCEEPICLIDCKVEFCTKTNDNQVKQSIMPPPSSAVVSSLFDILGLDKKVVHADDLLLALLAICNMVPGICAPEAWDLPPRFLAFDLSYVHPALLVWSQRPNAPFVRTTWAASS